MKDKTVMVVGAGNAAGQAVVHLSTRARRVILIVRGDSLGKSMSDYLVRDISRRPNGEIRLRTEVVDGSGDSALRRVVLLDHARGTRETVPADALFVLIGARPHTECLGAALQRDRKGFIFTGRDLDRAGVSWSLGRGPLPFETSMPGVFAVGDARQGSVKRVASAVGEGASVVRYIHEHLAAPVACAPALPLT